MNAEIITIGSELLLGQIVNTNARFISEQLADMGINVYYHTAVGDNPNRLKAALEIAEKRANIIILTGGLGPTKDDLTKETLSLHLNRELVIDENAFRSIKLYFETTKRKMTENNRKQAYTLKGSHVLRNDHGMAPGMILTVNKHIYMLLPGPPKEMEPMFLTYGKEALFNQTKAKDKIISRVLRFFGIGEALLETKIEDLIDGQSNPTIAPLASDGEVTLRLTAKHHHLQTAQALLNEMETKILERVGTYFYGYDETSLMNELVKMIKEKNLTIACAESLTGGMFQQEITSIPGAGNILKGGIVSYTNEAKEKLLQVKKQTIDVYGVVSEQCAAEMAENVRTLLNADIGISFTGVAGPDTLEGKPVGTVFIGIALKGKPTSVELLHLGVNRDTNRFRSVKYGCYFLMEKLKK
ncbi:competence/damage-inducible protein A [Bacillus aquiflavi]|uniref:Putative competence-damage inducible protein n=1 Tax=Bacillus aquiflavi TaxID=2672567 RepID=A0A6B3VQQ0_9BACI|nr:competence/damage-inducible protein A [Bacillus aquiflavi]MBA4536262.1 competence/damage-inducible protein A [Bacillus aquiflavi]NEY80630.1 competence/damage-inducible protein A [Bacillus aquiflavi]UAC49442.1 competence/damage-inducible protein A [Bacillus aquiflavi]